MTYKISGGFLNRNISEQERMGWYIQNIKRKKKVQIDFYSQQSCSSEIKG